MLDENENSENLGLKYPKKAKPITQHDKIKISLSNYMKEKFSLNWDENWTDDLPKKWKMSKDLLILPANCFNSTHWTQNDASSDFYKVVAECFNVKRVAQENRVKPDDYRSPNLTLLYGEDSIVTINNNGIK
jgi:tRNA G37 N-methylase Trm5